MFYWAVTRMRPAGETAAALRSLGDVEEVPFPGLTVVGGKGLAPNWPGLVSRVPPKHEDDRFAFEGVFAEEMSDSVFKRPHHRRVNRPGVTGDPIETP